MIHPPSAGSLPNNVVPSKFGIRLLECSHAVAALPLVRGVFIVHGTAVVERPKIGAWRFVRLLVLCPRLLGSFQLYNCNLATARDGDPIELQTVLEFINRRKRRVNAPGCGWVLLQRVPAP